MIRKAGIALLYRHGFEAMNLRQLAKAAGLKGGGSLYNYFDSKEDFLFRLMCEIMKEILTELEATVGPVADPVERITAFVDFHIKWHTSRRQETFISHMEMRSLPPDRYEFYVGLRKRYEEFVSATISAGCEQGAFNVPDVNVVTQSILSMLTSLSNWYRPGGRISRKTLIDIHVRMVLASLSCGDIKVPQVRRGTNGKPSYGPNSAANRQLSTPTCSTDSARR